MIFRVFIIIVIIEYQDWTYQRYALELRSTFFNGKNDKLQKTQCKSVRILKSGNMVSIIQFIIFTSTKKWYTSEYKRKIISRLLNWWQEFSFEVFMNFENFCQDFLAVSIFFRCTPKYSWNKNIYIFEIRITLFRLPVRTGSRYGAFLTFIWSKWIHRIKIWFLSFRTNLSILFQ